jgi:DNA-binding NtrC family response regulator
MSQSIKTRHLVIYADDDPDDLELVEEAFSAYKGHVELATFNNGESALQFFQKNTEVTPCLIILDINMPGISGKDVLKKIRQMDKLEKVPAVLFTTSNSVRDMEFAMHYNAGFITKPLDINQMEVIAEKFIDHCSDDIRKRIRTQMQ